MEPGYWYGEARVPKSGMPHGITSLPVLWVSGLTCLSSFFRQQGPSSLTLRLRPCFQVRRTALARRRNDAQRTFRNRLCMRTGMWMIVVRLEACYVAQSNTGIVGADGFLGFSSCAWHLFGVRPSPHGVDGGSGAGGSLARVCARGVQSVSARWSRWLLGPYGVVRTCGVLSCSGIRQMEPTVCLWLDALPTRGGVRCARRIEPGGHCWSGCWSDLRIIQWSRGGIPDFRLGIVEFTE